MPVPVINRADSKHGMLLKEQRPVHSEPGDRTAGHPAGLAVSSLRLEPTGFQAVRDPHL